SSLHDQGVAISIDLARSPHNVDLFQRLTQEYGNSAAALVLLESELARQALRPSGLRENGGSALPLSFEDVRPSHGLGPVEEPRSEIETLARQNNRKVEDRAGKALRGDSRQSSLTPTDRSEIEARGQSVAKEVQATADAVTSTVNATIGADGTLKGSSS